MKNAMINLMKGKRAKTTMVLVGLMALSATGASAGTDTTFSSLATMLDSWAVGSLGIVGGIVGVIYAGFSMLRGQFGAVLAGLGGASVFAFGPGIVSSMFTGII